MATNKGNQSTEFVLDVNLKSTLIQKENKREKKICGNLKHVAFSKIYSQASRDFSMLMMNICYK